MAQLDREILIDIEKRKNKRMNCDIPVEIKSDSLDLEAKATNISMGGCFVESNKMLSPDSTIKAVFELPYTIAQIKIKGKITRNIPSQAADDQNGMAMKFLHISDEDMKLLDQYIQDFGDDV